MRDFHSTAARSDRYTTGDVARTLHVTDEGVRHLVRAEQLPCSRTPSGFRLFQETDVLTLAAKRNRARLRSVTALRPKKQGAPGEPRQISLFGPHRLRKVK
jgi:hypothetical protein